jgi:hypothetical protein
MKKKINVKSLVIFGVLGVVMVLVVLAISQVKTFMSGATSDVEPQSVTTVSGDDGKSAVISWISDKESVSKVEYGTTAASLVLISTESSSTINHSISLTSLRPATTYFFRIKIGDEVFDNEGIPYSFKTKADTTSIVTVTPTVVPTIAAVTETSTQSATVCDPSVDYNKDGVVNSMDLATCKKNGGTVSSTSTSTTTDSSCEGNIADYNSDGVINSLDRLNCLQSQR